MVAKRPEYRSELLASWMEYATSAAVSLVPSCMSTSVFTFSVHQVPSAETLQLVIMREVRL